MSKNAAMCDPDGPFSTSSIKKRYVDMSFSFAHAVYAGLKIVQIGRFWPYILKRLICLAAHGEPEQYIQPTINRAYLICKCDAVINQILILVG